MGMLPTKVVGGRTYLHTASLSRLDANAASRVAEAERLAGVTIPRQSRGLSVAGPSKGPIRDGQKRSLRLMQPAIPELDRTMTPLPGVNISRKADSRKCQTATATPAEPGVFSG